jgi:broad specificity phosphatase PhoE
VTHHLYLARHGNADAGGNLSAAGIRQADLLGRRLSSLPLSAVHHSPLPRAAQTARLVGEHLPGVPVYESALIGDHLPYLPSPADLAPEFAAAATAYIEQFTQAERENGPALSQQALERFAVPTADERYDLLITHSQQVCWFVRDALQAPRWRWLGINAANAGLTVIAYRPGWPADVVEFNDQAHLPPELRWTGFS